MNTLHSARRWHFISGLPRSGSTLLAAILRQNKRVSADISSPVFGLCSSLINQVSAGRESSSLIGIDTRKRLIRGLFENYYSEQELPIIFDTNRAWTSELGLLKDLFPDSKVIVCVRDVGWIMDSLERLYQADPYEATRLFQFGAGRSTVYSRLEPLAQHDQLVGFAWSALRQAFYGPHASRLLIIDYDLLCDKPCDVLRLIYQFIGEDYFDHDFDSVEFVWGPSPVLKSAENDTVGIISGSPGSYVIPVTSSSEFSCKDTDYVSVVIGSLDTSNVYLESSIDTLINNEVAVLTAYPDGQNYNWYPSEIVGNEQGNQVEVSLIEDALIVVDVLDGAVDACFASDSIMLSHRTSECEDPYIFIPNAFTPNGDGENDVLMVRGINITDLYFAVYDRWGEKVFETTDQFVGWDGTFKGRDCDPAVYDFYLKYTCEGEPMYFQKGNVTIIR